MYNFSKGGFSREKEIREERTFIIATYRYTREGKRRERECKLRVNIPFLGYLGPERGGIDGEERRSSARTRRSGFCWRGARTGDDGCCCCCGSNSTESGRRNVAACTRDYYILLETIVKRGPARRLRHTRGTDTQRPNNDRCFSHLNSASFFSPMTLRFARSWTKR